MPETPTTATRHAPGRVHTGLLAAAVIAAPTIWMALGWASFMLVGPVTFGQASVIALAAVLAPVCVLLAMSYVERRDDARRHEELLAALALIADRIGQQPIDAEAVEAMRRINMRLVGKDHS
jgi:hypothetical protein